MFISGRTDAEEYADKLHLVSKILHNQCGLLFTNEPKVGLSLTQGFILKGWTPKLVKVNWTLKLGVQMI